MEHVHSLSSAFRPAWWPTRSGIAVIGFALVATFYGLREHVGHALGALSYLLLLACPLMHLFMHHGRDHYGISPRPAAAPQQNG